MASLCLVRWCVPPAYIYTAAVRTSGHQQTHKGTEYHTRPQFGKFIIIACCKKHIYGLFSFLAYAMDLGVSAEREIYNI